MPHSIAIERHGPVAEVRFGSPPANHLSVESLAGLCDALAGTDADPSVRAILLTTAGRVFCAGGDLAGDPDLGGADAGAVARFYDQAIRLFHLRKPVVAAIQGTAAGAGLGLAVAADFRVAAPQARFAAHFTALGFHPGFGLSVTLPRLIGPQRAHLMMMTSRRIRAEQAVDWGLADALAADGDLHAAALALAAEIATNAPLATVATRRTMRAGLAEAVRAALALELAEQSILKPTADHAEGVRAVFERRPACFTGR